MNLSDAEKKAVVSAEAQLPDDFVFGLDIGTRSIVGTVGYRQPDGHFVVVAQAAVQHETRAMTVWTIMIMVRKIPRNGKPKMRKSLRMVLRVLTLMRNAIEQIEPFERSVFQIIAG